MVIFDQNRHLRQQSSISTEMVIFGRKFIFDLGNSFLAEKVILTKMDNYDFNEIFIENGDFRQKYSFQARSVIFERFSYFDRIRSISVGINFCEIT